MGSIASTGIGSGLDVQGIVTKLVTAEGQPQSTRLDSQEASAQAQLSALGSLRSALAGFRDSLTTLKDLDNFRGRNVSLSSPDFINVTASSTAAPGHYQVEVQSLAAAHRLASAPVASGSTSVGTGTLTIGLGADSFTVDIASGDESLASIASAINGSTNNVGVFASVVTGVDGARLVLSSSKTGAANEIVVTQNGGDGGLAALEYDPSGTGVTNLTELQAASDATIVVDGFDVTSATNSVTDAISGLTIDLSATNQPGETTTVNVGFSLDSARTTVQKFVDSYNTLLDAVNSVASYDPSTKTGGPLFGDAGVRNIVYQLRREITSSVGGDNAAFQTLSQIGITTQLDGKLQLDSAKLDAAFTSNFDAVGEIFSTADTGVAIRLDQMLDPYLQTGGVFDSRNDTLKTIISDIGDQRTQLNVRLQAMQDRLLKQFSALDTLLSQMQSTSSYLTQQLANLPGFGG